MRPCPQVSPGDWAEGSGWGIPGIAGQGGGWLVGSVGAEGCVRSGGADQLCGCRVVCEVCVCPLGLYEV